MIERLESIPDRIELPVQEVAPSFALRTQFDRLARHVVLWGLAHKAPRTIGVTGLTRGVGTSNVAFNLAASLSEILGTGTLLVEADFGEALISPKLGLDEHPGLGEMIAHPDGDQELPVSPIPVGELSLLGSGPMSAAEAASLDWTRLGPIIQNRLGGYDHAIFDLPPAESGNAFQSIANHLDSVLLVLEAGKSDVASVDRFRRELLDLGPEFLGVVLNKCD